MAVEDVAGRQPPYGLEDQMKKALFYAIHRDEHNAITQFLKERGYAAD
jgi:hypothetical protein